MAAIAAVARAMETMTQFALPRSECKLKAVKVPERPEQTGGSHIGAGWVFHSVRCGKLTGDQQRGSAMRVRVLLQITAEDGTAGDAAEVASFEKETERPEDLGLSIAEGKALMAAVQQRIVNAQTTSWAERHRCCEVCGVRRHSKGGYPVVFMTLYGDVRISCPRLHRCPCQGPAVQRPYRHCAL